MTEDWQVPTGYGQGPAYQWGMAAPPPGSEPVYLVPRPPRPGVVHVAVILTYIGLAVAALELVITLVIDVQTRSSVSGLSDSNPGVHPVVQVDPAVTVVFDAVTLWLIPGAGAVVTAVLSARGANPARIVLASMMGLFTLVNLCQAAGVGLVSNLNAMTGDRVVEGTWLWLAAALHLVLIGLAVAIGVLLIVPAANRYYLPGPGRRFADGGPHVGSAYDRP
jgi:hypothetical protein